MSWKIEEARQHFNDLIQAVEKEPQMIYRQNQLVAVVVEAEAFQKFMQWQQQQSQRPLAQAFAELRQLCAEENYTLEIPNRSDRPNPFA
ncbi:type II toxin-antitoxin system Phd/YefM family antitoxin [Phormidesmis priestleyi ULC007]|uniref:Antitoxin n=1 Tax=Phormidesmis priestleyi ULC007 TaxID=1920490 RepID=A0A2T1D2S0_9CYAN|nr:type II toxin-antitoxin system Phd/YefM family antitoxin [Phormidesmis priestleyi]PSB14793.1 type II toxin-antitoxin system Phd/YefM family antitoxin [Phormidesmis priestleyi ULC007]